MTGFKLPVQDILQNVYDDINQALKTTGGGSGGSTLPTVIFNGEKNVVTAGTAVSLGSSVVLKKGVTIKAKITNTGNIYVGNSSVSSANGIVLSAGESVDVCIDDLSKVYIDSSVNGEGVTYISG